MKSNQLVKAGGIVAATALAFTLAACGADGTSAPAGDREVVFAGWGGAFGDAMFEAGITPWSEETGVKVIDDAPFSFTKLKSMVDNDNVTWDVLTPNPVDATLHCGTLLQPIDYSNIEKDDFMEGVAIECGVPFDHFATLLVYNTNEFGDNPPTSLADFFDTDTYPGKRLLPSALLEFPLEFSLIADGVDKDDLYPLDVDRALANLDTIKDDLVFWSLGDEQVQTLESEGVAMGLVWAGRGHQAVANGAPYEGVWGTHVVGTMYVSIPMGAPNPDDALNMIEFITSPEPQSRFNELIAYSAANLNAEPELDELRQAWDPVITGMQHEAAFEQDPAWLADHLDELQERWVSWSAG